MDQMRQRILQDTCLLPASSSAELDVTAGTTIALIVSNKSGSGRAKLTSLRLFT